MRLEGLLLFGLCGALLIGVSAFRDGPAATIRAADPGGRALLPTRPYAEEYALFGRSLGAYRSGEEEVFGELRTSAARLASEHGRHDAPGAVDYYEALGPEGREQGLKDDARFRELWREVDAVDPKTWNEERARLLDKLRRFIGRCLARADQLPAGQAASLCARIGIRQLEATPDLPPAEREALLARTHRDVGEALAVFDRAGLVRPSLEALWTAGRLALLEEERTRAADYSEELRRLAQLTRDPDYRQRAILLALQLADDAGDTRRIDELLAELASFRTPAQCWPLAREHALRLLGEDEAATCTEFLLRNRPRKESEVREWRVTLALAQSRLGELEAARAQLDAVEDDASPDLRLAHCMLDLREERPWSVVEELDAPGMLEDLEPRDQAYALSLLGEARLQLDQPGLALGLLERAVEISEQWEVRVESELELARGSSSVIGEWLGLHSISQLALARARSGDELGAALAIESSQSPGLRREAPATGLGVDDLLAWAAAYEHGLVTWVLGADDGLCVHVSREGLPTTLHIGHGRQPLADGVRRLREAVVGRDGERVARLSGELADALLPPELREALVRGPATGRLLILAHGPVERLPFEALVLEGRPLDECATLLVLPGLAAARPGPARDVELAWELIGSPLTAQATELLPEASRELEELAALRPEARVSSGARFTRAALVEALESPAPLHVATHLGSEAACVSAREASVGLSLSGGEVFCARELHDLVVRTPLVVLSACGSAEGRFVDARGLFGLARSMLEAGTRNLCVTLWPVRDDAARAWGLAFHRALLAGSGPAAAACAARAELRREGYSRADWAAFRLIGRD